MRLVHRPDAEGQLQPVLEPGRPGRPGAHRCREAIAVREFVRHPVRAEDTAAESESWVDPEYHQRVAEHWELAPRRSHAPRALVVDEDPGARVRARQILETEGYAVTTCPGPHATRCEASRAGATASARCPRVRTDTELVVLDAAAAATRVPEAYRAWLPRAGIRHAP